MSNENDFSCIDSEKANALIEKILKEKPDYMVLESKHIKQAIDYCCKSFDDSKSDTEFEKCVYTTLGLKY